MGNGEWGIGYFIPPHPPHPSHPPVGERSRTTSPSSPSSPHSPLPTPLFKIFTLSHNLI